MTVSSQTNKTTYAGDGSTSAFSTVFTFAANDEVTVTKVVTASGAETVYTLGTEYTLTGAGTGSAGTVTISTSPTDYRPASGEKLVIQLRPDFTQPTSLPRGGTVSPKDTLEPMHDRATRLALRLKDDVDRSIKLPIDETLAGSVGSASARANKILSFDASGAVNTTATSSLALATLQAFTNYRVDTFTGNGSTASYTLGADPGQIGNVQAYLDGVYQAKGDLTLSGQVLTFSENVPTGVKIEVVSGTASSTFVPSDNSIAYEKLLTSDIDTDLAGGVSGSHDTLASAKAIKTYVDAQVTAQDLDFQADSGGALNIDLDSESLTLAGGTGIDTVGSGNTVTASIDGTVATLTGSQTLSNKTLSGAATSGDFTMTGALYNVVFDASANTLYFADGAPAAFGTGRDLLIYHNGSNSYITENNTAPGNLYILATDLTLGNEGNSSTYASFTNGGAAKLYFNNSLKIETTSGGGKITGDLQVTGSDIELGPSNDTTISRLSAGVVTIEGQTVRTGTVAVANGGTGATTAAAAASALGVGTEDSPQFTGLTTTGDVTVGDDLHLDSDSAVLKFGDDAEITLTHAADRGLILRETGASGATATTSAETLVVESNTRAGISILTANNDLGSICFGDAQDADVGGINYDHSGNSMRFVVNGGEKVRIDSSGRAGIGEAVPEAKLHVTSASSTQIWIDSGGASGQSGIRFEDGATFNGGLFVDMSDDSVGLFTRSDGSNPRFQIENGAGTDMVLDTSGNLGIGTTPTNKLEVVGTQKTTSQIFVGAAADDNYSGGFVNLSNTSKSIRISADPNNAGVNTFMSFSIDGSERIRIESDGDTRPGVDNSQSLGNASYRWSEVFAGNGTINTSDQREKTDIADLDEAERRVATALKGLVRKYRFKDAVAAKGDAARIHVGVIAQEVVAAFDAEGLDATRYALLCHDEWDAVEEVLSDDGDVVTPGLEAGDRYGIRYDQLLAFIISAL